MVTRTSFNSVILGIFLRNMALDGVIIAAIAAFGFIQGWFDEPIRYLWLGNAFLLAGLAVLVLAGLSTILRRTDLAGQDAYQDQGAFPDMNAIGIDDYPGPVTGSPVDGKASFWEKYAASLSLALAGMDVLMVGIVLQVVGR